MRDIHKGLMTWDVLESEMAPILPPPASVPNVEGFPAEDYTDMMNVPDPLGPMNPEAFEKMELANDAEKMSRPLPRKIKRDFSKH
jgi:hypothetical protein